MSTGYQTSDAHIIDYALYHLPGIDTLFRGPPIKSDRYIACIGAAQTFGRFTPMPFPTLLSRVLGIDALNLACGGVGPTFYLNNLRLMDYLNRAQLVIVQVFSGRSVSNSMFDLVKDDIYGINRADGRVISADEFYTWLLRQDSRRAKRIVMETRDNYVSAMMQLLASIKPPKILLWFSVRAPKYREILSFPLDKFWGAFPHFVNDTMIDRLRGGAEHYVQCVSRRGLPQPIFDRYGRPSSFKTIPTSPSDPIVEKSENSYYPSPEMHEDAATLLLPACRALLTRCSRDGPAVDES